MAMLLRTTHCYIVNKLLRYMLYTFICGNLILYKVFYYFVLKINI